MTARAGKGGACGHMMAMVEAVLGSEGSGVHLACRSHELSELCVRSVCCWQSLWVTLPLPPHTGPTTATPN